MSFQAPLTIVKLFTKCPDCDGEGWVYHEGFGWDECENCWGMGEEPAKKREM